MIHRGYHYILSITLEFTINMVIGLPWMAAYQNKTATNSNDRIILEVKKSKNSLFEMQKHCFLLLVNHPKWKEISKQKSLKPGQV